MYGAEHLGVAADDRPARRHGDSSSTGLTTAKDTKDATEATVAPEVMGAEPVGGPSRGPGGKPP